MPTDAVPAVPPPVPAATRPEATAATPWGTPLQVAATSIAIVMAPAAGAAAGLLGLTALGLNALQNASTQAPSAPTPEPPPASSDVDPMGNGIGSGGCVAVDSRLPGRGQAGDVKIGMTLQLSDPDDFAASYGIVTHSTRKTALGVRIETDNGVTLVCSESAPIPTPDGLVLAPDLLGKQVAVRIDRDGDIVTQWRDVRAVSPLGPIQVQHITVGDRCFWAGEKAGRYILHHNMKAIELVGTSLLDDAWW